MRAPTSRKRPVIFVSHVHEDIAIAIELKNALQELFLGFFEIFVSSDGASIRAGENWSDSLEVAMKESELVLVLVTGSSRERRWIFFEAGGAYFMGKRVIPICCRELTVQMLEPPLSWLQAIDGRSPEGVARLLTEVATSFGLATPRADLDRLSAVLEGRAKRSDIPAFQPLRASPRALPIFILLDSSGSMHGRIDLIRQGLLRLVDYLRRPDVPYLPMLSVVTFDSVAQLALPPTAVTSIGELPHFPAGGAAALGAGLEFLATILDDPVYVPKNSYVPFVIVVSDGEPTDNWRTGWNVFRNSRIGGQTRRLCLALGCDAANDVLREISNVAVLPMIEATDMVAVANFFRWFSKSISIVGEEAQLELPPPPAGMLIVP